MKDIIKIIIALAFVIGSYILGSHQADEKYQSKIEELNIKVSIEKKSLTNFQDSIKALKQAIDSQKFKYVIKSLPIKPQFLKKEKRR